MNTESVGFAVWKFARTVLGINLLIAAIVYAVCWWEKWFSPANFGTGLIIGGIVAWAFGVASSLGGIFFSVDSTYQYVRTTLPTPIHERAKVSWLDLHESYGFLALMIFVGLVSVVIGNLIVKLAG